MGVRYLRRPVKARGASKAAAVTGGTRAKTVGAAAIDVTPEEREQLAQALAYFCVACGREHTSGEVRACDVALAEAEIIAAMDAVAAIRRFP